MTEAVTEVVVLALQWEIRVLRYELVGRVWAAALATCVAAATSHPCHPFVVLIVLVVVLVVLVARASPATRDPRAYLGPWAPFGPWVHFGPWAVF